MKEIKKVLHSKKLLCTFAYHLNFKHLSKMENKKNFYRINNKMYNYVGYTDTPYSTLHYYQEIDSDEKFCIEEQTIKEIEDEKKAWNIE